MNAKNKTENTAFSLRVMKKYKFCTKTQLFFELQDKRLTYIKLGIYC